MPRVEFDTMPESARVWVFGAAAPVLGEASAVMLQAVDRHLHQWNAHGVPLVCARLWRDDRFLVVAVDERASGASGCSIDGMFRVLADVEREVGTTLVGGGRVFWKDDAGAVQSAARSGFIAAAKSAAVSVTTTVFDTTVTTVQEWRQHFERPAGESWHARLLQEQGA